MCVPEVIQEDGKFIVKAHMLDPGESFKLPTGDVIRKDIAGLIHLRPKGKISKR